MTEIEDEMCKFPISYNNNQYNHCILIDNYPQCLIDSGAWKKCFGNFNKLKSYVD